MSDSLFSIPSAMKAAQWERAKGELRALVAMQGSHTTGSPPGVEAEVTRRWTELRRRVEAFIEQTETDALQE